MSETALEGLEPRALWARFGELARVPRPPQEEDEARAWALAWAGERRLAAETDAAGNVVVRVPATPGRERAPVVVLQAHLDMVCERDPDSPYDARAGRLRLVRDGDWLRADGTTLGADNGIGVAAALAAAEDPGLVHGPLELLLTVSEEQGLEGAKALDPALLRGRLLLNLDGSSDGALTVGCAGSAHTFLRLPLEPEDAPAGSAALEVVLSGALGGHSGGDIARGRLNAIKGLGRVLGEALRAVPYRLAGLEGGVSRNAIPREARARVVLVAAGEAAFRVAAGAAFAAVQARHAGVEQGLRLRLEPAVAVPAAREETTTRALDLLQSVPTGVLAVTPGVPEAVETSTSLTVARTQEGTLTLASMTRSASASALDEAVASLEALGRLAGASVEVLRSYPPWEPAPDADLVVRARTVYERLFGEEPRLHVVHGGLECAVLGAKLPGAQLLALGPEIVGPHAPGERVSISSTARFYRFLGALLDELSS